MNPRSPYRVTLFGSPTRPRPLQTPYGPRDRSRFGDSALLGGYASSPLQLLGYGNRRGWACSLPNCDFLVEPGSKCVGAGFKSPRQIHGKSIAITEVSPCWL